MDRTICAEATSHVGGFLTGRGSAPRAVFSSLRRRWPGPESMRPATDPCVSGSLWGWPDTKSPLGRTRAPVVQAAGPPEVVPRRPVTNSVPTLVADAGGSGLAPWISRPCGRRRRSLLWSCP